MGGWEPGVHQTTRGWLLPRDAVVVVVSLGLLLVPQGRLLQPSQPGDRATTGLRVERTVGPCPPGPAVKQLHRPLGMRRRHLLRASRSSPTSATRQQRVTGLVVPGHRTWWGPSDCRRPWAPMAWGDSSTAAASWAHSAAATHLPVPYWAPNTKVCVPRLPGRRPARCPTAGSHTSRS